MVERHKDMADILSAPVDTSEVGIILMEDLESQLQIQFEPKGLNVVGDFNVLLC